MIVFEKAINPLFTTRMSDNRQRFVRRTGLIGFSSFCIVSLRIISQCTDGNISTWNQYVVITMYPHGIVVYPHTQPSIMSLLYQIFKSNRCLMCHIRGTVKCSERARTIGAHHVVAIRQQLFFHPIKHLNPLVEREDAIIMLFACPFRHFHKLIGRPIQRRLMSMDISHIRQPRWKRSIARTRRWLHVIVVVITATI